MEFIFKLKWLPTVMAATLCVFVFIISSAKSANIMANFYKIESSRLNVPLTYTTLVGISKMDCCVNCLAESTCNSVNYRESPPIQCELISLALNDVDLNRKEASGWAVYSKTGKLFILSRTIRPLKVLWWGQSDTQPPWKKWRKKHILGPKWRNMYFLTF